MIAFRTESFDYNFYSLTDYAMNEFVSRLASDPEIQEYLPDIYDYLEARNENLLDNAYIVSSKSGVLCGYLNLIALSHRLIGIQIGVEPDLRGVFDKNKERLGCKMLREASNYILTEHRQIKLVQGVIKAINVHSIRCAKDAGFVKSAYDLYNKRKPTGPKSR